MYWCMYRWLLWCLVMSTFADLWINCTSCHFQRMQSWRFKNTRVDIECMWKRVTMKNECEEDKCQTSWQRWWCLSGNKRTTNKSTKKSGNSLCRNHTKLALAFTLTSGKSCEFGDILLHQALRCNLLKPMDDAALVLSMLCLYFSNHRFLKDMLFVFKCILSEVINFRYI